jgi:dGTPase
MISVGINDSGMHIEVQRTLKAYGRHVTSPVGAVYVQAHADSSAWVGGPCRTREEREAVFNAQLAPGATRAVGAGNRAVLEEPDAERLCHEVDEHRIIHSGAYRRLAGKTQVFVQAPGTAAGTAGTDANLRNRLTHAQEVAQIGESVARAVGLNPILTRAMCLGHDLGHGPFGHASEDAFNIYAPSGTHDHAVWGGDVVAAEMNLCEETLDAIRNHSWKRPAPATPEGEVCSWADRIGYLAHDYSDAVRAGIIRPDDMPTCVAEHAGTRQAAHIRYFVRALIHGTAECGRVAMAAEPAAVLKEFRSFMYERVYLRPASRRHAETAIAVLHALVEFYIDAPGQIPDLSSRHRPWPDTEQAKAAEAVRYVASMTDQYAMHLAVTQLGWDPTRLPLPGR